MSILRLFGRSKPESEAALQIYGAVVAQARRPEFYRHLDVPDTLDGRFEMIALHAFLVLHRLKGQGKAADTLAQAVFDCMFTDMDRSLREMGVGDLGVSRRVKAMAQGFYGRIAAYEKGLADGDWALRTALGRNAYGTVRGVGLLPAEPAVVALCDYLRLAVQSLADCPLAEIASGRPRFPDPPSAVGGTPD